MNIIDPKYKIGNKVWSAQAVCSTERIKCPDCKGTRKWDWTSPGGLSGKVDCPRCRGCGDIELSSFEPYTMKLTIGSVRYDSAESRRHPVSYMCNETGVGSGRIYYEDKLFDSEEEAKACAEAKAAELNAEQAKNNPRLAELRYLSGYDIIEAAKIASIEKLKSVEYRLGYLLDRICGLSTNPVVGGRYNLNSCVLTKEQVKAIQESLVWLDEESADYLDEYRRVENG